MGRKKTSPVVAQPQLRKQVPRSLSPPADCVETSSASITSTTSSATCPVCNCTLQDVTATEFKTHVAACSRPSTANEGDDESDGSLTPPPKSPVNGLSPLMDVSTADLAFDYAVAQETNSESASESDPDEEIHPYVNPQTDFDFYDQETGNGQPDVDLCDPNLASKFKYPKITPMTAFENYLKDPQDMEYDELYRRTAKANQVMVAWQSEWDEIDKITFDHEAAEKFREEMALERKKLENERAEDEAIAAEDEAHTILKAIFRRELLLTGDEWATFLAHVEVSDDVEPGTHQHLQNLKNPQYMDNLDKRRAQRERKRAKNQPCSNTEVKLTKAELDAEKRKRGRLMDSIKFDDMKQADVHGFEYSAAAKHYGQQLLDFDQRRNKSNTEHRGSRTARINSNKRTYDQSSAGEDEPKSQELPEKRARKARVLDDGAGTIKRGPRQKTYFPSGKPIGRPPNKEKSKLKSFQLAPSYEASPSEATDSISSSMEIPGQQLQPAEEAQLLQSAQSLIHMTSSQLLHAEPTFIKKKHAGGRPRKALVLDAAAAAVESSGSAAVISSSKPKSKAARVKKSTIKAVSEPLESIPTSEQALTAPPATIKRTDRKTKMQKKMEEIAAKLGANDPDDERNAVLQSTEHDDETEQDFHSRPSTSSSVATGDDAGEIGEVRRSQRSLTQEKTQAREAKAAAAASKKTEVPPIPEETVVVDDRDAEYVSPSKAKRVKGIMEDLETSYDDTPPSQKKRKVRAIKEEPDYEAAPKARKRKTNAKEPALVPMDETLAAKPKRKVSVKGKKATVTARPTKIKVPAREPSQRKRRPTLAQMDGANDDDDDEENIDSDQQTEYDAFQALTSPSSPRRLKKRERKSYMNMVDNVSDSEDAFHEDEEDPEDEDDEESDFVS